MMMNTGSDRATRGGRIAALSVATSTLLFAAGALGADEIPTTARRAAEFEAQAARAANAQDDTRLRLQAGASLATGNTRSFAGSLATRFQLRRGDNQLTVDGAINYGRASVLPMGAPSTAPRTDTTTAENYLLRARYDRYFLGNNSLFVSALAFRDQPSGFDARLSGQVGYLRNIVNQPNRRKFWGEVGYDLTHENLTEPPNPGENDTRTLHFARLFLGFEERATSLLELTAGVEGLINVLHPADFRINATVGAASKISDDFSLALTFTARYLNEPIGEREPLDTVSLISVIYQRSFQPAVPAAVTTAAATTPAPSATVAAR